MSELHAVNAEDVSTGFDRENGLGSFHALCSCGLDFVTLLPPGGGTSNAGPALLAMLDEHGASVVHPVREALASGNLSALHQPAPEPVRGYVVVRYADVDWDVRVAVEAYGPFTEAGADRFGREQIDPWWEYDVVPVTATPPTPPAPPGEFNDAVAQRVRRIRSAVSGRYIADVVLPRRDGS